ncbi:MAG: pyridoxamine 5'-phosphate oxidase family protein [Gallicola sp.]|nr:pyridoxamine 5'-phosphate oxidase family protein [Gallicola sp.]
MRRKDREINTIHGIEELIKLCKTVRIGMVENEKVHIVPVNFGYSQEKGQFVFYIHSAKKGHKVDVWEKSPNIAFEMDYEIGLDSGPKACDYGYFYQSVIGHGEIFLIEDKIEKEYALNQIMVHQTGQKFEFTEKNLGRVNVYKIIISDIIGKACLPPK